MTAPEDAVVVMIFRAECLYTGGGAGDGGGPWHGKDRTTYVDAAADRRLHLLVHVGDEIKKGGGKR